MYIWCPWCAAAPGAPGPGFRYMREGPPPPSPFAPPQVNRPLFSRLCSRLCRRPGTSLALSKASKITKMASKTHLGGHLSRQDGPRCLQYRVRSPGEASRALQEDPQEGPKKQTTLMFIVVCSSAVHVIAVSSIRRSKTAPRAPKSAPRRPERPPKGSQDGPRGPQNGFKKRVGQPKIVPRQPQERPNRSNIHRQFDQAARRGPQGAPIGLREAPRGPQDAPKQPPKGLKTASNRPPRGLPRYPNEHPRCLQCPLEQSPPSMPDWHGGGACRRQLDIYIYIYIYVGERSKTTINRGNRDKHRQM